MAKKTCLHCGLHLPDTTTFCPECGRPIEDVTRVESGVKIRSTTITKGCPYCGLHLPDTTTFCPECGRPIERDFEIRPIQESKIDCPHKKLKNFNAIRLHPIHEKWLFLSQTRLSLQTELIHNGLRLEQ